MPFYWGFDLGMIVSADEMYKMLMIIEKHTDELAKADPSFTQIGGGKMAEFQKKALKSTADLVPDSSRPRQISQGQGTVGQPSGIPASPRQIM